MTKVLDSMLLAGVALATGACAEEKPARTPNVVFILADDLGWGDLSCYGQKNFETPNIDALARGGVRFTQCYSGTTVSAPSRSCLLTGTHSGHTPVRGNLELDPEGQFPLPDGAETIFHDMRKAGYRTGAFGKWGLGYIGTSGDPANQGVDEFMASIASFLPTATMRATSGITRKELNWKTMWTLSLTGRERIFQNLSMKKLSDSSKIRSRTENPSSSGIRPQYRTPS